MTARRVSAVPSRAPSAGRGGVPVFITSVSRMGHCHHVSYSGTLHPIVSLGWSWRYVMGEKVGAVLFGGAETVDVQQVLAHCREQLADFKIPQYIVVSGGPLPRNPGGKLLKAQLRKSVEWGVPL